MTPVTEQTYQEQFDRFLVRYWGAVHEALEAQSVSQTHLAGSLFRALLAEHQAFQAVYTGASRRVLDDLGRIWHLVESRRRQRQDAPLTHDEIARALDLLREVYDSLVQQGQAFTSARQAVLSRAPHGTPRDPLRADAGR